MDSISENSPLLNKPTRVRKVSVDYQGNFKDVDMNGNTPLRRRMSNCSENPIQMAHIHSVLVDAIKKSRQSASNDERASGAWENAFLEQIQSLIQTVKVTDSLTDCISEEMLNNENNSQTAGGRTRRKSCFAVNRSVSYKNATVGGRRLSVTDQECGSNQGPPRRRVSHAGLENINFARRNSAYSENPRRVSVTSQTSGRRNSVVTNPIQSGRRNSVVAGNGRRNSVVTSGRRSSVAHLPGYGAQGLRRLSISYNSSENQQRRSSVVKPACFNVSKISNIQRRLHRIYRQRRRKQRAHVDVEDVRSAIKADNGEKSDEKSTESESEVTESSTSFDNVNVTDDDTKTDENSNIEQYTDVNNVSDITVDGDSVTENTVECTGNDNEDGSIPNPRRKTSIQIRSWEISRQLRSRRRQKRKSGKESELI